MKEDLEILLDGNDRACLNFEPTLTQVIDPSRVCLWKDTYLDNINGIGTSFRDADALHDCAGCNGFDQKPCYLPIIEWRDDNG